MAVGLCMVLLRETAQLPLPRIVEELRARYPELNAALDEGKGSDSEAPSVGVVQLRDGHLALACMPIPIPWSDLEGPCATSVLWNNATEQVKQHVAHVVVSVLTELDEIKRSVLLTQVTTAVLAACDAAMGVYWGNASLLVPKAIFTEFAVELMPKGPPLPIWVDFRVGWQAQKRSAGFTQGMTALGHMEMEARDWPEKPSELRERLGDLALYLLDKGHVIKDGDTVGHSASEKIRVVYAPSEVGHEGLVMQLRYEAAHRPWWKIW